MVGSNSSPPERRRTRQITFKRVAEGCKRQEIADSLGTTEHVVKNYLRV